MSVDNNHRMSSIAATNNGKQSWRQDIQGMRGLSISIIVLYHADIYLPGGFVGLDVFFVIAGFVITGMILRGRERTGQFSLRDFYLRRLKRLTPALLVTVIAVLLLSVLLVSPIDVQDNAALTGIGAVFFSANIVVQFTTGDYFSPWTELNPLMHTWSLSLEEQYYLAFPVILLLGWWLGRRFGHTMPVVLTAGVFAISLWFGLYGVSVFPQVNPAVFGYFSPVGRTWEFAAGALLAFGAHKIPELSRRVATGIGAIGLLLLFAPIWLIDSSVQYPGPWTLAPVTATILLIVAGFQPANLITCGLSSRIMVYTGDRSYSWYLWHWPVIVFAFAMFPGVSGIGLLAAAISIGPALLSFRFVEQWTRYADWSSRTIVKRVGLIAIVTLVTAAGVLFGARHSWWNERVELARTEVLQEHIANATGCHIYLPISADEYNKCLLQPEGNGKPVVLVGDSNADHLSDAFVAAGKTLGRPVNVVSASSCPFIVADVAIGDRCQTYIDNTMRWLEGQQPSTVAVSTSGSFYDVDGEMPLSQTVKEIEALGHEVVLVKPVPFFFDDNLQRGGWDPSACTALSLASDRCAAEISLDDARLRQGTTWDGLEGAAERTGAVVLDFSDQLCPDGICKTNPDGRWAYQDFNHLTVSESLLLTDVIIETLTRNSD